MQLGANYLLGEHDFTSFRALECQAKSPVRRIHSISLQRQGDMIILEFNANGFLHHMVRNIVGVLLMVGSGVKEVSWVQDVLLARNRSSGGMTAPAYGLYLTEVTYADKYELPAPRGISFI
jgi:tRNA pseudouridine38-40 synthase